MKIGSRRSPLALAQSHLVAGMLAERHGRAPADFPISAFMTSGDKIQGRLQEAGGKGLFTKELDEALLDGRIDCAVHSMKDLPTKLPDGIVLAAVPAREDPRDGFIATRARTLAALPEGATIGTASLRRQARRQVLHRMHGTVDAAVQQRLVQLLGEQALAALFLQAALQPVAAGHEGLDREGAGVGVAGLLRQHRRHGPRLCQRQRRTTGADDHVHSAIGGMDDRMLSTLPPVLRPKVVPRS